MEYLRYALHCPGGDRAGSRMGSPLGETSRWVLGDPSQVRLPELSFHSCVPSPFDPTPHFQEVPSPKLRGWRTEA